MHKACVVFSLDDAYIMPFKVLFHSLEATDSIPEEAAIFILHSDALGADSIHQLVLYLNRYGRSASFIDASHLIPDNLPIRRGDHVSPATFYRLFIAEILPKEIDQAVYLDADMIALRSISSLFTEQVTELIAAADHCAPAEGIRLWGDGGGNYLQAGVLVIPLQVWRQEHMAERFVEVLRTEKNRIQWWDQDVLNIALNNRWQRLPVWCNVCDAVSRALPLSEIERHGLLIHYSGSSKPWNAFHPSPFTGHWDRGYASAFGIPFDRGVFLPSRRRRLQTAVRSRLSGLIHGRL